MFERILTDPLSRGLLRAVVGERFKMRGYNIRRMSGAYDPPPAHEWHRNSRGEFFIPLPSPEVIEKLSPAIQEVVRQDQPQNAARDTVVHQMLATRRKARFRDPFYMARLERRIADAVSWPFIRYDRTVTYLRNRLAPASH